MLPTVSKSAQTKWPSHRINRFACANPRRGDVSPSCPGAPAPFFSALGLARGFYRISPSVNWTSAFRSRSMASRPEPFIKTSPGPGVRAGCASEPQGLGHIAHRVRSRPSGPQGPRGGGRTRVSAIARGRRVPVFIPPRVPWASRTTGANHSAPLRHQGTAVSVFDHDLFCVLGSWCGRRTPARLPWHHRANPSRPCRRAEHGPVCGPCRLRMEQR
jgi:hypothetical protein